ncbi:MAG: carbohydrate-binding protein, partial [Moraxellaceae bacterium]
YAPYAYTSTDLGGHMDTLTVEQYVRWVQYGALSPIFRLHCGQGYTRDPWDYAAPAESVVRKFVQMRMRLLPVFYALARDNYDTGEPILRRLDLDYPAYAEATRDDQYLLGKNILIAPIAETGNSRSTWIPPGTWINVWDGSTVTGPVTITANANQEQMPIFVKRGALIALAPDMQYTGERRWDPVTLDVYPLPDNTATTTLYEDDGISNSYKSGSFRKTALSSAVNNAAKTVTVKIAASSGTFSGAQANRAWKIRVRTPSEWSGLGPVSATVNGVATTWNNLGKDSASMPFQVTGGAADAGVSEITLSSSAVSAERTVVITYGTAAFSRLIEAESYTSMAGVQLETTTDTGGGQNVGWIEANDWMAYANINFPTSGNYKVEYRVASPSGSTLSLDLNAGAIQLGQLAIPATGGWQTWATISHTVNITAGTYAVGVFAPAGGWNINWIKFTKI